MFVIIFLQLFLIKILIYIFSYIFIGLEDKATACQMLVCYARELKEHFVEYTEDTVKLMVPMLKFYFHDGVRSAAAESLPCLIGNKNHAISRNFCVQIFKIDILLILRRQFFPVKLPRL